MTKAEKSEIQDQLHRLSKEYNELCEQEREIRRDAAERVSEIIRLREESYRRYKELERKISNK